MTTCIACKDDACEYAGKLHPKCDDWTAAPPAEPPVYSEATFKELEARYEELLFNYEKIVLAHLKLTEDFGNIQRLVADFMLKIQGEES